jgi:hypothetical protein
MFFALTGNVCPVLEGPYGKLPYIYLTYVIAGLLWFFAGKPAARDTPPWQRKFVITQG